MRCPGCGSELKGSVGTRCARCGFLPTGVAVTPMEYVVRLPTQARADGARTDRMPRAAWILYGFGLAVWLMPIALLLHYRANPLPGASIGWRALGTVLAFLLAFLVFMLSWAGAFFYTRFVTSNHVAQEAERVTDAH